MLFTVCGLLVVVYRLHMLCFGLRRACCRLLFVVCGACVAAYCVGFAVCYMLC